MSAAFSSLLRRFRLLPVLVAVWASSQTLALEFASQGPPFPANARFSAGMEEITANTDFEGTSSYGVVPLVPKGIVIFGFPDTTRPAQPVLEFRAQFDFLFDSNNANSVGSIAFNYGDLSLTDFGDSTNGAGGGLSVILKLNPAPEPVTAAISVLWRGRQLSYVDNLPVQIFTPGALQRCYVQLTNSLLSVTLASADDSTTRTILQNAPLEWNPENNWQFGLSMSMDSGDPSLLAFRVIVAGFTPPYVPVPVADRSSWQDDIDEFTMTLDSLEDVQPANIVVTAESSAPSVIPTSNIQITSPTANTRRIRMTPPTGVHGDSTITLQLDPGGGMPVGSISYRHTIKTNIPPSITSFGGPIAQPYGITRSLPFTISSPRWSPDQLKLTIVADPTLVSTQNLFPQPADSSGTNWNLVFTPVAPGRSGTISVQVTDGSGDSAKSGFTLNTTSLSSAPMVLGAGSALALNLPGPDAVQVPQYAVDQNADDTGVGGTITVEAWVFARELPNPLLNVIAAIGLPGQTTGLILALQPDGSPLLANWINDFYPTNATYKVKTNEWHHVAAVVSGQAVTLYVDGQVSAAGTLSQTAQIQPGVVYVGSAPPDPLYSGQWYGYLDSIRIWSTARSNQDILQNYQGDVASDAPGLLRYFRCNDGFVHFDGANAGLTAAGVPVGGTLQDSSVKRRHASLVGLPAFVNGVPQATTVNVPEDNTTLIGLGANVDGTNVWGTAGISQEVFFGPVSGSLASGLLLSPGWPGQPDVVLANGLGLEMAPTTRTAFGQRWRGYLVAPETGVYQFAIASANEGQLWISTDASATNLRSVAASPATGVSFRRFDYNPALQTANVSLVAGQRYYFEVRHQADNGANGSAHLSVRWTLPSGLVEAPIPAYRIQPPGTAPGAGELSFEIRIPPQNGTLALTNGMVSYHPTANFIGQDSFTYQAGNASSTSAPVTVSLKVLNQDDAPVAGSQYALELNGTSAGVASLEEINMTGQSFTVELWARRATTNPPAGSQTQTLWSLQSSSPSAGVSLGWQAGGLLALSFTGQDSAQPSPPPLLSPVPLLDGDWHHWAATFDANTRRVEIFRNAVSVVSTNYGPGVIGVTNVQFFLGSLAGVPGTEFAGTLDEVRLWNQVRSAEDLQSQMGIPLTGSEDGLLAYYRFDEGNGLTAYDSSAPKTGNVQLDASIVDPVSWVPGITNFLVIAVPRNSPGQSLYLPGFDFERQPLTYQIISPSPQNGRLVQTAPGVFTYTPNTNFHGLDTIVYSVTAGGLTSEPYTLTIDVEKSPLPPVISSFRDVELEEEDPALVLPFTVGDVDDSTGNTLTLVARSSNPSLLPLDQIVFGGTGNSRTVTLNPVDGEIGTSTVELEVSNGDLTAVAQFTVRVNPRLIYVAVNVGETADSPSSVASGLNAQGQLAGWIAGTAAQTNSQPFFYSGYGDASKTFVTTNLGGPIGGAFGLNNSGIMVGAVANAQGALRAFQIDPRRDSQPTDLGVVLGGNESVAKAINDSGLVVGYAQAGDGTYRAFTAGTAPLTALPLPDGYVSQWATAVNSAGLIAGYALSNSGGNTNAFLYSFGQNQDLGRPPGSGHVVVSAVTEEGTVYGYALYSDGATSRAAKWDSGQWTDLGDFLGGGRTEVTGVNRYGQIVGRSLTTNGVWHAVLYTEGRIFDLNSLLSADSPWTLADAAGINDLAQIAATGVSSNSPPQALLLFPASEIGRRVFRPENTIPELPDITILQGPGGADKRNSFFWSTVDQKLFAIRPVVAEIRWRTGTYQIVTNLTEFGDSVIRQKVTNEVLLSTLSFNIWPANPDIHIVNTPVQVQPTQSGFQYGFVEVTYTTADKAQVDASTQVFTSTATGYSVLHYLKTGGRPLNPQLQSDLFRVTKSVLWNDPLYLVTNVNWTIGVPLTNALHHDYPGLNGFTFFTNAPYDGAGLNAAYDRTTRKGAILPVNTTTAAGDLVVVWYQQNSLGVAWSGLPYQYSLQWPTNAPTLVIASGLGSGPLPAKQSTQAMVYEQSDPTLPGFNPNEEHALISGGVLFALRNDLNNSIKPKASDPFTLLKYLDSALGEWRLQVYAVIDQLPPYIFRYPGVAGEEIQPPLPVSLLPLMATNQIASGPAWKDVTGRIYARAAGVDGGEGTVVMRYYYPMQPGFFYDLNRDGTPDYKVGDPVPWLDLRPGGIVGRPIDVSYAVEWPTGVAPLQVGQSLTTATGGLPDIEDMAAAQVIFDSLDPTGNTPISAAARLYDPLSPRTVPLDANFQFPGAIQRSLDPASGLEFFPDLPYVLRVRLFHDPRNRLLGFRGYLYTPSDGGAPITLVNVMSIRERQTIAGLDTTGGTDFGKLVTTLYQKTRNPNDVDLDGNGSADEGLLIGLTMQTVTNNIGVTNIIVRETLKGPKALTAGQPVPPLSAPSSYAVQLDGTNGAMPVGPLFANVTNNFTIEFWVRPDGSRAATDEASDGETGLSGQAYAIYPTQGGFNFGSGHVGTGVSVGTNGISVFLHGNYYIPSPLVFSTNLTGWHHVAVVFEQQRPLLYLDGNLARVGLGVALTVHPSANVSSGDASSGNYGPFAGSISDLRVWNYARLQGEIAVNLAQRLTGAESGLVGLWRFDENQGTTVANATAPAQGGTLVGGFRWTTNGPPRALAQHYVVIAENNDSSLTGLPVDLHVIRVDDSLARGALAIVQSDNVLDERVTLRHTADFAGQPESFVFQWYYQVDQPGFKATNLPAITADGTVTNLGAWVPYPEEGPGVNDVTLGAANESSLLVLSDSWWVMRYGMTTSDGRTNWSSWVGDPSGTVSAPRAMLVPGWIKRVLNGINLFAQRSSDFEDNTVNVLASTIAEAGPRFEGDVALNPNSLDNFGLIEIYETILRRGMSLSIDGTPPVDYLPADSALLLAAGNIAQLYMLHANEAFADAADPTIGLTTDSTELGSIASSVFAFENQVDSLLEEELAMLRGRDDSAAGVSTAPVYNRLYWNFTGGEGETAYVAKYGIPDQNSDGFITALDAKLLYPQGHGDAWGHYLTALTTYYDLLRNPYFTWTSNPQSTLVAGVPIQVNYADERRFALAAAAKARTGSEIMDRTWRLNYTDDPVAQFRGEYDPDPNRAWSTTDWARRAAQGAYFDWVAGNAILPPLDTLNTGIQRVDRTTVGELTQIVTETAAVTTVIDQADAGLNPSGLARGMVAFDIDPDLLRTGFSRETHFEQVYDRAIRALQNAEIVFNRASLLSSELRKQQNSVSDYSVAVTNQELDYKSQLISIFGSPYSGTMGSGQAYPTGYDGPDLLYWNYVDTLDVTPANTPRGADFLGVWSNFTALKNNFGAQFSQGVWDLLDASTNQMIEVTYPVYSGDYAFQVPSTWGTRKTEGQLQANVRALVLAQAQLRQSVQAYQTYVKDLTAQADFLGVRYQLKQDQIKLVKDRQIIVGTFDSLIQGFKFASIVANGLHEDIDDAAQALMTAVPGVVGLSDDAFAFLRGLIYLAGSYGSEVPSAVAEAAEITDTVLELGKTQAGLEIDYETENNSQTYEVSEQLKDLEITVRQEPALRLSLFQARQSVLQAARNLEATLAAGQRVLVQRTTFRKATAGTVQADRYRDLGLRIFRNDALEKYDTQFQLAARYVHLAAAAYDYELNLGNQFGAGSVLGSMIVRERNLGELADGEPIVGRVGLASILGQLHQNFAVLKGQLGVNNDRPENSRFSLRTEAFRLLPAGTNASSNLAWQTLLRQSAVSNLWDVPEFRRYCRSFAPESAGAQPGLVLRFGTTVQAGQNFFGKPLGPLDSSYDPSEFSTRIKSVAVWLSDYDAAGLAAKPRVYLVPVGADRLRSSDADNFAVYNWQVLEQRIPVPFPITAADLAAAASLPTVPSLDGSFSEIRRHSAFRAYQDASFDLNEFNESSRLVGRSVWNTQWVLIIPGAYLLGDPDEGLTRFMNSVSDIKLYFQTYSTSGN